MMKRLATGTSMVLAVLALSWALTATASALPEIHVSSGELFPVTGEGVVFLGGGLSTALSAPITFATAVLRFECGALGSLCPYTLELNGSELEGKKCGTSGGAFSTILIASNELHFVSSSLKPLDLDADLLVAKFTITCVKGAEELKITVEGQAIGKIEGVTSGVGTSLFSINLKCTKKNNGQQEVKEFFNDEGKAIKGVLKANLGLGPETACLEIRQAIQLTPNKMVVFLF
jgi:hypothetical protein